MLFFLKGLIIGVIVAAPVGPVGVLCVRRTLTHGRMTGFISGIGAASADVIFGAIAGFGLTAVTQFLLENRFWIQLVGSLLLFFLGYQAFRSKPPQSTNGNNNKSMLSAFTSTFLLTLTNPLTVFSFMGIFAVVGVDETYNMISALILVAGVFLGSVVWWLSISMGISLFRHRFKLQSLVWINRISGFLLIGFGILIVLDLWSRI